MEGLRADAAARPVVVPLADILRPNFASGEKVAIPVANYTPWASFKYVQGVPAGNEGGFPVSKLQVIDTLIDSLVGMRDRAVARMVPDDRSSIDPGRIDALIDELAHRLQAASAVTPPGTAASIGASFGMAVSQTGAALNLMV